LSRCTITSWFKRLNDSPDDDLHHIQNPQPPWPDDLRHGHQDDILCVAECPPSLLASGSHDGEVIVWNLVSGHLQCRFLTPLPPDQDVDRSVLSIIFLRSRTMNVKHTTAACLVSSGHRGQSQLYCTPSREDTLLYVADEVGYIYVFDIKAYALGPEPEDKGPKSECMKNEDHKSVYCDCFSSAGTFGQSESWSVHTPASWKHPAVPYEILIDSLSMPTHPVLEKYSLDTRTKAREDDLNVSTSFHFSNLLLKSINNPVNTCPI
uniref:Uncharacterized protein n=1 Tax=Scleropages formosus TaxID=113540 RepID=A0A8C9TGG4_SCLFO